MRLPDEFKFKHKDTAEKYTARRSGTRYDVAWGDGAEHGISHTVADAAEYVREGCWIIQADSFPSVVKSSRDLMTALSEDHELTDDEVASLNLLRGRISRRLNDLQ
jgi:hypothetical protein